ncbi:MAG TPA: hypothetical protein VEB21_19780, partial [Terriglobales bacterium]|nr:hypothetical protein [Terriglobales bacterium]
MENPSSSPLASLAQLQRIDSVRREKQLQIQALEAEISAIDAEADKRQREMAEAKQALQVAEARRKELEAHLESEGTKMKDRRMRLNRVRNEKELQALRHEIEVGKELNQQVEEEVLQLMEKIESLSTACNSAEETLSQNESQSQERKQQNQEQLVTLRREIEEMVEGRQRLADSLER